MRIHLFLTRGAPCALVLAILACGGGGGGTRHSDFPLPGTTAEATPAGGDGAGAAPLAEGDPATCMPAGTYVVTFDYSDAQFTVAGLDEAYCRNLAEAVAVQGKSTMTIERGDLLVVRWPEREAVVERGGCGFDVVSEPVRAEIRFGAGRGVGTAAYAVGASNHPDEVCAVRDVRLRVEP